MNLSNRRTFKSCFAFICTRVVAFMVGYWFYKYEVEDRDIGVVDYASLEEEEDIEFPAVSLCFEDPFLDKNLRKVNSNITRKAFRQYLEGELTNDELTDGLYEQITYSNVTLDLGQYLMDGYIRWQNGSWKFNTINSIDHIEVFNGFDHLNMLKCFTIEYNGKE